MTTRLYSRIAMLGAAPETHGSIAAAVDAYRAHGLFKRWPITYIATHGDGALSRKIAMAGKAAREFAALLAEHRRVAVHVHVSSGAGFWREAAFMGAAFAAGCPVALQLHGSGYVASSRWLLEHAAIVCVPCEAMRTWVRSVARNAAVALVPPPVALAAPEVAEKPNLVLFLGRLDATKGIYDLLDAIAAVRATVPAVRPRACAPRPSARSRRSRTCTTRSGSTAPRSAGRACRSRCARRREAPGGRAAWAEPRGDQRRDHASQRASRLAARCALRSCAFPGGQRRAPRGLLWPARAPRGEPVAAGGDH